MSEYRFNGTFTGTDEDAIVAAIAHRITYRRVPAPPLTAVRRAHDATDGYPQSLPMN